MYPYIISTLYRITMIFVLRRSDWLWQMSIDLTIVAMTAVTHTHADIFIRYRMCIADQIGQTGLSEVFESGLHDRSLFMADHAGWLSTNHFVSASSFHDSLSTLNGILTLLEVL